MLWMPASAETAAETFEAALALAAVAGHLVQLSVLAH